jgi:protein associated with RNAse G/E
MTGRGRRECQSNAVELLTTKWGGAAHKRGQVRYLGEDHYGTWLWGPSGRTIQIGDTGTFVTEHDAVFLLPRDAWWACAWWIDHPEVELYVDICTPSVREGDTVGYVDLDLDVIRFLDGHVEIDDRDEFEVHQVHYGYPADVIAAATLAADVVSDFISRNQAPFDGIAAREWARRARGQH